MHRRYLFADADHFRLFDVYDANGDIHPHLYAYSNRHHEERALVLYNNFWERADGWIHTSSPFVEDATVPQDQRTLRTEQLGPALGLTHSWKHFAILQEQRSGLWFIRNSGEICERGLFVSLNGYESQVFLNVYEVEDNQYSHYARLADSLNGAGTRDVQRALKRLLLQPLHDAFGVVANTGVLRSLATALGSERDGVDWRQLSEEYRGFLGIASQFCEHTTRIEDAVQLFEHTGDALMRLPQLVHRAPDNVGALIESHLQSGREDSSVFLALALLIPLDVFVQGEEDLTPAVAGFRALDQAAEWELVTQLQELLSHLSAEGALPSYWEALVKVVLAHHNWWAYTRDAEQNRSALTVLETLLADSHVEDFLQVHVHNGVTWYNKEAFELMIDWLMVVGAWHELTGAVATGTRIGWTAIVAETTAMAEIYREWQRAERNSEFRVDALLAALEPTAKKTSPRRKPSSSGTGSKKKKTPRSKKGNTSGDAHTE